MSWSCLVGDYEIEPFPPPPTKSSFIDPSTTGREYHVYLQLSSTSYNSVYGTRMMIKIIIIIYTLYVYAATHSVHNVII